MLAYAATPQGTEANALYGTPDEICAKLEALQAAGVEYVILTLLGGMEQLRRFARDIMPAFADAPARREQARGCAKPVRLETICRSCPLASATFP